MYLDAALGENNTEVVRQYADGEHLSWSDIAFDTDRAGERFDIKPRHGCSCWCGGQAEGDVVGRVPERSNHLVSEKYPKFKL